jgi:hypothetical protein
MVRILLMGEGSIWIMMGDALSNDGATSIAFIAPIAIIVDIRIRIRICIHVLISCYCYWHRHDLWHILSSMKA